MASLPNRAAFGRGVRRHHRHVRRRSRSLTGRQGLPCPELHGILTHWHAIYHHDDGVTPDAYPTLQNVGRTGRSRRCRLGDPPVAIVHEEALLAVRPAGRQADVEERLLDDPPATNFHAMTSRACFLEPMLCRAVSELPQGPAWSYELKFRSLSLLGCPALYREG